MKKQNSKQKKTKTSGRANVRVERLVRQSALLPYEFSAYLKEIGVDTHANKYWSVERKNKNNFELRNKYWGAHDFMDAVNTNGASGEFDVTGAMTLNEFKVALKQFINNKKRTSA